MSKVKLLGPDGRFMSGAAELIEGLTYGELESLLTSVASHVVKAPDKARKVLLANPALCYALAQSLVVTGRITAEDASEYYVLVKPIEDCIRVLEENSRAFLTQRDVERSRDISLISTKIGSKSDEIKKVKHHPKQQSSLMHFLTTDAHGGLGGLSNTPANTMRHTDYHRGRYYPQSSTPVALGDPQRRHLSIQTTTGPSEQCNPPDSIAEQMQSTVSDELVEAILEQPDMVANLLGVTDSEMEDWPERQREQARSLRAALLSRGYRLESSLYN